MALEYIQLSDPCNPTYSPEVEKALDFLYKEVHDEPSNLLEPDEVSGLYGIMENDKLVAAAEIDFPHRGVAEYAYMGLLAVVPERRGQGFGRKLVRFVELEMVGCGITKIFVDPVSYSSEGPRPDPRGFFEHLGYTRYDPDPGMVTKDLSE